MYPNKNIKIEGLEMILKLEMIPDAFGFYQLALAQ